MILSEAAFVLRQRLYLNRREIGNGDFAPIISAAETLVDDGKNWCTEYSKFFGSTFTCTYRPRFRNRYVNELISNWYACIRIVTGDTRKILKRHGKLVVGVPLFSLVQVILLDLSLCNHTAVTLITTCD